MVVVFFGPPGSGKGTQVQNITLDPSYACISTGNMLRAEIASGSKLGNKLKTIMGEGNLVSDEIILEVFESALEQCGDKKIILDGVPRTLAQAKSVDEVLERHHMKVDSAIEFKLDDDILLQRILGRYSCKDCGATYHKTFSPTKEEGICDFCGSKNLRIREDDQEEVLKKRLDLYYLETLPILGYYRDKGVLHTVDAALSPHAVSDLIESILKRSQ